MSFLVLHTYGILKHADDHAASQDFLAAIPDVQASQEIAPGLLRGATFATTHDGVPFDETSEFGATAKPIFHDPSKERTGLATLSVWSDPESAAGFSFHGTHGGALKFRSEWFQQDDSWPSSVMWWADELDSVSWDEANRKIAYLAEHGPSTAAFSFKSIYSSSGEEILMNTDRVKEIGKQS
jgi:hypothetical protein